MPDNRLVVCPPVNFTAVESYTPAVLQSDLDISSPAERTSAFTSVRCMAPGRCVLSSWSQLGSEDRTLGSMRPIAGHLRRCPRPASLITTGTGWVPAQAATVLSSHCAPEQQSDCELILHGFAGAERWTSLVCPRGSHHDPRSIWSCEQFSPHRASRHSDTHSPPARYTIRSSQLEPQRLNG